jgi:hypothetical protein
LGFNRGQGRGLKYQQNYKFIAGSLANNIQEWERITSDPWILSTISGYKIEFEIIDQEILDLLMN